jgi:dihydroxyacetone kinase
VYSTSKLVAENIATVGASLSHVHVPGRAKDADELTSNDEIEIGMGIHNEEGFGRVKADLSGLVKTMLAQLLDLSDKERGFLELKKGDDTVLLVNNLGGLSQLEVGAVVNEVSQQLGATYGAYPKRILSGTYMSSLNGLGFSITLLKVVKPEWLDLIDLPVEAAGWTASVNPSEGVSQEAEEDVSFDSAEREIVPSNFSRKLREHICQNMAKLITHSQWIRLRFKRC